MIWGSTYLAIRVAVESLPPLASAGARFTLAGLVLAAAVAIRRGPSALLVPRPQLLGTALVGICLLLLGNGLVMVGERDVPSALAALIIGSVPLWIVLYRRVADERIEGTVLAGVLMGFLGVGVLVVPRGISGEVAPIGLLFVVLAAAFWAWGTFMSKRMALPRDAFVGTALQQLLGGVACLAAAALVGERVDPNTWSSRSLYALAYLVVFGSLLGFSAYTWLLVHVPVSMVSTYAYVNPVVAVLLGALILAEPITSSIIFGAMLIVTAVAFIVRTQAPPAPEAIAVDDERPPVGSAS